MFMDQGINRQRSRSCTLQTLNCLEIQNGLNEEIQMIWARFLKVLTNAVLAVIALGAAATIGHAQNTYQGKFTIAVETQWGGATIPPGDYSFVLVSNSFP